MTSSDPLRSAVSSQDRLHAFEEALERTREYIRIAMKPESVKAACCETAYDRAERRGLQHGLNALNAEFAKAEAVALASASASPHLAWRPIQTAPKDRRIVVWLESDRKGLVCWQEKAQRWLEYGMGFCDPLYWFDVPAPDLDDAGETHDTVLS